MSDEKMDGLSIPAVIVAAKEVARKPGDTILLSTGVKARLKPVSATLIDAVTSRIKDPDVPRIYMEEKQREIANPDDPDYLRQMGEANRQRGLAALDALIMFGVELVDPMPPDEAWLDKLHYMEKRKLIDLSEYDLADPMEKEFVYKRLVAVAPADIELINRMNRANAEDFRRAENSF